MEHYKSTLATTAVAVFGLVAAAHILHPGNYEVQPRPARPPVSVAMPATAWVDPPAEPRLAATPTNRTADAPSPSGGPALLAPQMTATLRPGETMTPALPGGMTAQPARARTAAVAQRRKVAQRPSRTRQASLDRGTAGAEASALRAEAPVPRAKIDPIGDLIRGLGLGGES